MNSIIETLNHLGGNFLTFAWPMFWQSSLLVAVLFAFDFLLRRKIRASIRYALWLVILVKLCLPPTFALQTSPIWWLHKTLPPVAVKTETHYTVTYDNEPLPQIPQTPLPAFVPPKPAMTFASWLLVVSSAVSLALLLWLLVRWRQVTSHVRSAKTSERLTTFTGEAQKILGIKFNVPVKLTTNSMSPAVCGLLRPAILIPQSLADNFSDEQLRAVLLHELIHLRRRDVWLNFLQALLQIFYWWHPLVWLANARIRRVREDAVDDAVMLALRDEAESYAPTLLEVAKLALNRPLASLGLVGILESRHALRQRIERLVDFRPPRKAGLTLVSLLGILAFTAVAVPMGGSPTQTNNPASPGVTAITDVSENLDQTNSSISAEADLSDNANTVHDWITVTFKINDSMDGNKLKTILQDAGVKMPPTVCFYTDNGILLVRGPKEQVALVHRIVLKLNGFPQKNLETTDRQFISQWGAIKAEDSTNLFERTFKMDKTAFTTALQKVTGLQTTNVSTLARDFFSKMGVDFDLPGKSIVFNDKLGLLFVRATEPDLDAVERIVQALNQVEPQVHIKARFIEVPTEGFVDPATLTNNPGGGMTGILYPENFKIILHSLESLKGAEMLGEPEATSTSGRQIQMFATKTISVVTNFTFQETSTNSGIKPQSEQVEIGPVLDVVPYVLSDGYTINLTAIPSVIEFLGYDKTMLCRNQMISGASRVG
jgi:beta-lactamase regulating signal transducer with metallopeptidase domain